MKIDPGRNAWLLAAMCAAATLAVVSVAGRLPIAAQETPPASQPAEPAKEKPPAAPAPPANPAPPEPGTTAPPPVAPPAEAAPAPPAAPAVGPELPPRIIRVVCTDHICGHCDGKCHKDSGHVAIDKKGHCACTPTEGSALDVATRDAYAKNQPK
jgi:hypothetical protein